MLDHHISELLNALIFFEINIWLKLGINFGTNLTETKLKFSSIVVVYAVPEQK